MSEQQLQLTEIMPGKKYVLVIAHARRETALKIHHRLNGLLSDEGGGVLIIQGLEVTIVPADQIAGYTVLGRKENDHGKTTS